MRELKISQSLTERNTSVEFYFNDVARLQPGRPEDEATLAQKIRQGDQAALDRLIKANLRFVISVAKKYQHMGLPLADLISEGNLGLIKAAKRFDETRGFKFISLAVWWIRQSILQAIADQSRLIRLPLNHINILTKVKKASGELEGRLERAPTDEELAELSGIALEKIADTRCFSARALSYDAPLGEEADLTLLDRLSSGEDRVREMMRQEAGQALVNRLFAGLTPDERVVMELSYGLAGKEAVSPPAIAGAIGLCESSVHAIRKRALKKIRAVYRP
jgi:RNA polymerase primary sigma factor